MNVPTAAAFAAALDGDSGTIAPPPDRPPFHGLASFDEHDDGRADLIQDGDGPNHAAQPDVHDYGTVVVGMVPEGNERIAA